MQRCIKNEILENCIEILILLSSAGDILCILLSVKDQTDKLIRAAYTSTKYQLERYNSIFT